MQASEHVTIPDQRLPGKHASNLRPHAVMLIPLEADEASLRGFRFSVFEFRLIKKKGAQHFCLAPLNSERFQVAFP